MSTTASRPPADVTVGLQPDQLPDSQLQVDQAPVPPTQPAAAGSTQAFVITSFVLGLASIASGWTFVVPVVGLVFGILALRRKTTERTLALWGVWLNAAMLALSAIVVIFFIAAAAFGLLAVGSLSMPAGF